MAKIIDLEQGTHPWFVWRLQGIGGSDIAAILGIVPLGRKTPYVSLQELLAEKCGANDRQENFAMRRGRRLEPEARMWYEAIFGVEAKPACVEHESMPWIRASLDGFPNGSKVLEIKAPKAIDHDFALSGMVPPHYRPQVQWEMLATGVEECDYFSFNDGKRYSRKDRHACVPMVADHKYWEVLITVGRTFWELVQKTKREMHG